MSEIQFKTRGFVVWGICALFFLYEFLLRTVMGTYQHPIMADLHLSSFQFSFISTTVFLIIAGLMQIPVGFIVDNIGLKKSLLIGTLTCAASVVGFAYCYSFPLAVLFRLTMGIGAAFGFICLLMAVYDWMPHRYLGIFIGLSQFIGTMGPMLAAGPLDSLSSTYGVHWRHIFLYLGVAGMILALLTLAFVKNNVNKTGNFTILYYSENLSKSIIKLFSRFQPWYLAIFSACIYFTVEYLSENEGRTFLSYKGISLNSASYMLTISWIGYAIGCPLLGLISDLLQRRKIVMITCAWIGFATMIAILYGTQKEFLQVAFFFLGFSAAGQSVAFATISEHFKKQFIAVGFALNNAIILIFAAINAPLIGILLDNQSRINQITLTEYISVFNVLVAIFAVAIVISTFYIRETFCKSAVDFTFLKLKASN